MKYVVLPAAKVDLTRIWLRIAYDSADTADEVESAIYRNCELIASQPEIGRRRRDLTQREVLFWPANPYRNYNIVYRRGT